MLYPTHQRFGILWGLVALPIGVFLGLIPILSFDMSSTEMIMVIICGFIGMRGSLFGAEFPDIDSPSSIPRKKHPLIGSIFDACGVKHRGIYSHDFVSIGLTFGTIYLIVNFAGDRWINSIMQGNTFMGTLAYIGILAFVWIIGNSIVELILWIANLIKNKKMWATVNSKRIIINTLFSLPVVVLMSFMGIFDLSNVFGNIDMSQAVMSAMIIVTSLKIFTVFSLVGAYSHLFADMLTKSGVSIFFKRISPMGIVSKFRKLPLGKIIVPLEPRTGGRWENLVRYIVTGLCIPASIIAVMVMTGKVM